ncbi:MAG TPA: hypothetical protein VNE86_00930 [Nitrososphaerales archaeon]|nr:hypothetical protein [Nitrososphaerales archaeon]
MPDNIDISGSSTFRCEICKIDFPTKRAFTGHNVGKHRAKGCSICKEVFDTRGKLGLHKIEVHGFTRERLGWRLVGGWNKGMPQMEAFVTEQPHHGQPDFMRLLNAPAMLARKKITRRYYEDMVLRKELELRAQGYRTFCTSNYTRHNRVPDIIAISPDGRVIAVEMETIRRYKSSVESLRKKYTLLLMKEGFFDDVIVEGFLPPNFSAEDSNTPPTNIKLSKKGE